ncbi:ATP cone domain-containing protein, partial [Lysinibacillus sp. D4A1_S13]|uniref:ATP cone domain-containing protein n=1 Tax=Lysinibacillus sp. D4A1_S13 TaxID=2941228 RepID=UPI0020BF4447
ECEACHYRFTTFEKFEEMPLTVVKREGVGEEFSREKMLRGLIKACEKMPVPLKTLEDMCFDIEKELRNQGVSVVKSELVGEMVMDRLAK